MATAAPQQFCVRWNSYHANLQTWFPRLLSSEQFADVTLACESRQLRCHKIVLSACSAYLERLLATNPCKHPIVLMRDMRFSEMQALVDFMYKGEVNVTQDELPSLLRSAEALQIRGLCSSENGSVAADSRPDSKDFTVASDALLANAQRDNPTVNGPSAAATAPPASRAPSPPGGPGAGAGVHGPKKKDEVSVKEETVEEDGLYYGELDADNMEYNEDEEPGKPGSSLGQTSDFAISNVQCQYDSGSETDPFPEGRETLGPFSEGREVMDPFSEGREAMDSFPGGGADEKPGAERHRLSADHTYGRSYEPPAFLIRQCHPVQRLQPLSQLSEPRSKLMTLGPAGAPGRGPRAGEGAAATHVQPDYGINKRIRRSEVVLRQAADCVSRGLTFQTVSHQFNIPISTIRFFMARKGILPRRRRGRTTQAQQSVSPEPPYHMQHFKLPAGAGLSPDGEEIPDHLDRTT